MRCYDDRMSALRKATEDWTLEEVRSAMWLIGELIRERSEVSGSVKDDAVRVAKAAVVENALLGGEQNSIYTSESITVRVKNYYVTSRSYDLRIRGLLNNDGEMMEDDELTQEYDDPEEWLYTEVIVPSNDQPVLEKALKNLDYSAIGGTVIDKD